MDGFMHSRTAPRPNQNNARRKGALDYGHEENKYFKNHKYLYKVRTKTGKWRYIYEVKGKNGKKLEGYDKGTANWHKAQSMGRDEYGISNKHREGMFDTMDQMRNNANSVVKNLSKGRFNNARKAVENMVKTAPRLADFAAGYAQDAVNSGMKFINTAISTYMPKSRSRNR